jgi:hypothetical protein
MPLDTISGAGHPSNREAGVIAAPSFGIAAKRARSAALERAGKIKWRPAAADGNTGEADIRPQDFREHEGRNEPGRDAEYSLFIRLLRILILNLGVVKQHGGEIALFF